MFKRKGNQLAAISVSKKQEQEKKLDQIESMLKALIHQVETRISSYQLSDVESLRAAYRALNKVTLLTDAELEQVAE